MSRFRRAVALLAVLAVLLTACGDDEQAATTTTTTAAAAATTPTTSTEAAPTTPLPAPAVDPIAWASCGGAQCATVAVPVDHAAPDGPTLDLFVRRLPATGERIGALFLNFGGPGAPAAGLIDRFPIPDHIRQRFDIVGMDPRGVGQSSPLDCGIDPQMLYSVDPTVEDAIDAQTLIDVSRRYADDCDARKGTLLAHLGTRNVARDMDRIRAGMGDDQLSYVGFSYGTAIGQAYADLFPDRVRAMILDGVVDPAPDGIAMAEAQAVGFETALANWAAGCPVRRSCRFGDDAIAAVDQVLALAEDGIGSSSGARALGPGEAALGIDLPLYQQSLWGELDRALADAIDGDGRALVALADQYLTIVEFPIYFAVSCLDTTWPRSTDEFLADAKQAAQAAPRFGESIVNDYLRCAVWPADPDPLGAISAPGTPPSWWSPPPVTRRRRTRTA